MGSQYLASIGRVHSHSKTLLSQLHHSLSEYSSRNNLFEPDSGAQYNKTYPKYLSNQMKTRVELSCQTISDKDHSATKGNTARDHFKFNRSICFILKVQFYRTRSQTKTLHRLVTTPKALLQNHKILKRTMGANKNSDRKEYHKSSTNHRAQKSRQDKQADRPAINNFSDLTSD